MTERRLKKSVIYGVYSLGIIALIGTIYLIESSITKGNSKDGDNDTYVSKTIFDDSIPVIADDVKILRPYSDAEIKVIKSYYDYKADEESQKNAIIFHEDTYMQSSGVAYGGKENFEVKAVLEGTVVDVKEDKLLGKIVEIKHSNDVISVYQSLSEVTVSKDAVIKQGDVIGKSGNANISTELGNHLYFELIVKGTTVNPEEYFDKLVKEI